MASLTKITETKRGKRNSKRIVKRNKKARKIIAKKKITGKKGKK